VWFFSGSDDAVYLSLSVATSRYVENDHDHPTRPRSDTESIRAEAQLLRSRLDLPGRLQTDGIDHIDFGLQADQAASLGSEAKRRVRNFEAAHICGFRYERGQIPNDELLMGDQYTLMRVLLDFSQL
jgi:hypothetical protein